MRWVLRIAVFVVLLGVGAAIVVGLSHFSPTEIAQPPESLRPPPEQAPYVPPPAPGAQWRYTGAGGTGEMACTRAEGDVAISPTAQSAVLLCVRRSGVASIALADRSGRFACGDCQLRATFDGAPRSLAGTTASSDGSAYTIFLSDSAGFEADLRRVSKLTVTFPVKGTGDQTASFDVEALHWN
jgi:hypothetical protein